MLKIRRNGDHISFAIAGLRSLPGWSTLVRNIASPVWAPFQSGAKPSYRADGFQVYRGGRRLKEAHLRHPKTAIFRASKYGRDTPADHGSWSPRPP